MPTITDDPETDTDTLVFADAATEPDLDQPWNVIVFDDPVNYMGFVTLVLKRVFGYNDEKATRMMLEVHEKGKSVVWSGVREKAEFYVQQLQSHQLLCAMKKSN